MDNERRVDESGNVQNNNEIVNQGVSTCRVGSSEFASKVIKVGVATTAGAAVGSMAGAYGSALGAVSSCVGATCSEGVEATLSWRDSIRFQRESSQQITNQSMER